jgi:hypothetical protein
MLARTLRRLAQAGWTVHDVLEHAITTAGCSYSQSIGRAVLFAGSCATPTGPNRRRQAARLGTNGSARGRAGADEWGSPGGLAIVGLIVAAVLLPAVGDARHSGRYDALAAQTWSSKIDRFYTGPRDESAVPVRPIEGLPRAVHDWKLPLSRSSELALGKKSTSNKNDSSGPLEYPRTVDELFKQLRRGRRKTVVEFRNKMAPTSILGYMSAETL